jgi:hypothetical protein
MCELIYQSGYSAEIGTDKEDSREKGLSVLLVVSLVGVEHTVHPWQELLGTVVSVKNDGTKPISIAHCLSCE